MKNRPTDWQAPSLKDAIDGGYEPELKQSQGFDGRDRYQCDCGRVVLAKDMTDVRASNAPSVKNQDFVCDGCTSKLLRNGEVTKTAWMAQLGCPVIIIDEYSDQ